LKQGPSQNILYLDWTLFWATNKKHIDPIAARYTAIFTQDAVTADVAGIDTKTIIDKAKHARSTDFGTKKVVLDHQVVIGQEDARSFSLNEEITLMNWGNALVSSIFTDPATGKIVGLRLTLHPEGSPKTTQRKMT